MTVDIEPVETPGGVFAVRRRGHLGGKPVRCLHGFPDDASTFDGLSEALGSSGYDVVSLYLRGYHPSPLEGPYDLGVLVDDVIAVLDSLGWAAAYLVGHDYGAQIGFAAMSRHPGRFTAAVTLSGPHPASIARNTMRPSAKSG